MPSKFKISLPEWEKMFERTVKENDLKDERLDQDLGQTAFSLTKGTVSSPVTNLGKYRLGRAFLIDDPALEKTREFIESNWSGQWKNVEKAVSEWLNPVEVVAQPVIDRRKYTLPCGHKTYRIQPGASGTLTCFNFGCGGMWRVQTTEKGEISFVEVSKPKPKGKP